VPVVIVINKNVMSLKVIVKTLSTMGYSIVHDKKFSGFLPFTREYGRYLVSDHEYTSPFFIVPPAKSFWFHIAGDKFIVGLWAGLVFLFDNVESLLKSLDRCFDPQSENFINRDYIQEYAHKISIYSLVNREQNRIANLEISSHNNENKREHLSVSLKEIINFISLHDMNYKFSDDRWINFSLGDCNVYLRIPSEQDKPFDLDMAVSCTDKDINYAIKCFEEGLGGCLVNIP
jgi:hypothetical protein